MTDHMVYKNLTDAALCVHGISAQHYVETNEKWFLSEKYGRFFESNSLYVIVLIELIDV